MEKQIEDFVIPALEYCFDSSCIAWAPSNEKRPNKICSEGPFDTSIFYPERTLIKHSSVSCATLNP